MFGKAMHGRLGCWAACCGLVMVFGCGAGYQVGEVDGQLLIDGQPGHKVRIEFIPDVAKGTKGPGSTAETDEQGHFVLQLQEGNEGATRAGAVVGWHRVVLSDLQLAASETGVGVPIRLAESYTLAGATKLEQEIKPGKQTIRLEAKGPKG